MKMCLMDISQFNDEHVNGLQKMSARMPCVDTACSQLVVLILSSRLCR